MRNSTQNADSIAFIGCGFMATAILQGLLAKRMPEGSRYSACVRSDTSLQRLRKAFAGREEQVTVGAADAAVEMAKDADVVVLGCVPGDLDQLMTSRLASTFGGKIVISLLAGVSTTDLLETHHKRVSSQEDDKLCIARVIPSIGAKIGDSVTLLAKSATLPGHEEEVVRELFSRIGSVLPVPERLMNDATAIGAVCHALSIQAVDAIADAGVAEGMDRSTAVLLAAESLRSSSNLFCAAGGMTPEQLKEAMSTPRGITINSVLQLQRGNVPAGISDAVRAAVQYSRSM